MPVPTFPARAAARLFLERQHLDAPRSRPLTPSRLRRFAEDTGGIQLDSVNVVDRAHYLAVWSRFGPYDRAALRPARSWPSALLRVLGARGVPRAGQRAAGVAPRDARLPHQAPGLGELAPEEHARADEGPGNHRGQRADGQRRLRLEAPGRIEGLVELESRPSRAAPPLDDGRPDRRVAPPLPQAFRSDRARGTRGARRRARLPRGVRALARRAVAPRHGRGDGEGPRLVPLLSAVVPKAAPRGAPRSDRPRRGRRRSRSRGSRPAGWRGHGIFRRSGAPAAPPPRRRAGRPCSRRSIRSSGIASACSASSASITRSSCTRRATSACTATTPFPFSTTASSSGGSTRRRTGKTGSSRSAMRASSRGSRKARRRLPAASGSTSRRRWPGSPTRSPPSRNSWARTR